MRRLGECDRSGSPFRSTPVHGAHITGGVACTGAPLADAHLARGALAQQFRLVELHQQSIDRQAPTGLGHTHRRNGHPVIDEEGVIRQPLPEAIRHLQPLDIELARERGKAMRMVHSRPQSM